MGLSFHCRIGSLIRFRETFFLFLLPDLEPNFDQDDSAVDNVTLDLGTALQESLMLLTRDKPMTYSTPARLYQLRSKTMISPAAGKHSK